MADKIKELQLEYFAIVRKKTKELLLGFLKVLVLAVLEGVLLFAIDFLGSMKVGAAMVFTLQIVLFIFVIILLIVIIKEGWKCIKLSIAHIKDRSARDLLREIKSLENGSK